MERLNITQKGLPLYDVPPDVELYTLFNNRVEVFDLAPEEIFQLAEGMRDFYPKGASTLSGYAYLGQFLAHDVSRLRKGGHDLRQPGFSGDQLISSITPKLDLGSVYDWTAAEDMGHESMLHALRERDSACMALGNAIADNGQLIPGYDLPREQGVALIADDRNDENLIISQLHLQFLRLHNAFVHRIQEERPDLETEALFEAAKTQVILHYQDVMMHDFLYEILHPDVWKALVYQQEGVLWQPTPGEPAVLPIEYTGGVGRFGHAMVRDSYNLNQQTGVAMSELFALTGEGELGASHNTAREAEPEGGAVGRQGRQGRSRKHLPASHLIDWLLFFDFPEVKRARRPAEPNRAIRISPGVRIQLKNTASLSFEGSTILAIRNIQRGMQLRVSSAQDIIDDIQEHHAEQLQRLGIHLETLDANALGKNRLYPPLRHCERLYEKTPLWFYSLAEAYQETHDGKGKLGVLGSLILADTIMGLLKLDTDSILHTPRRQDLVTPTKAVKEVEGKRFLQMSDLILAANPGLPDPAQLNQ